MKKLTSKSKKKKQIIKVRREKQRCKKSPKKKYQVRNWRDYNQGLINRGNITLYFADDCLERWFASKCKKRGHPALYHDDCIRLILIIRSLFHLPLRAPLPGIFYWTFIPYRPRTPSALL